MTYRILKVLTSARETNFHTVGLGFSKEFAEELLEHLTARYATERGMGAGIEVSFKIEPDQQNVERFSYGRR